MTGAFAHGAIFSIRDYNLEQNEDNGNPRLYGSSIMLLSFHDYAPTCDALMMDHKKLCKYPPT